MLRLAGAVEAATLASLGLAVKANGDAVAALELTVPALYC